MTTGVNNMYDYDFYESALNQQREACLPECNPYWLPYHEDDDAICFLHACLGRGINNNKIKELQYDKRTRSNAT